MPVRQRPGAALLGLAGVTWALAACAGQAPPGDPQLPMGELMAHVFQHGADEVWKWQGVEVDAAGERSLFPATPEQWEEAESASLVLAELTHVLLLPGRRIDEPEWDAAVAAVRRIALQSAAAAERQDEEAFFAAGGRLNDACDTCHVRYDREEPTGDAPAP
jgi:hypothetical protein